jgi:DNA-directed RNA polymerase subunit beta'
MADELNMQTNEVTMTDDTQMTSTQTSEQTTESQDSVEAVSNIVNLRSNSPAKPDERVVDFESLKVSLASPDQMKEWSFGEVTKAETINYRTQRAEKGGLFAEEIFGPTRDWQCFCGKYKGYRYKGIICDKCSTEITQSRVRRERLGHIDLSVPVVHIWFFKGAPSALSLLLDISPRNLSSIVYFSKYIVLEVEEEEKARIMEQLEVDRETAKQQLVENTENMIAEVKEKLASDLDLAKGQLKDKEALSLKQEAVTLKAKQQMAALKEQLNQDIENNDEIYNTIVEMVKRIKTNSILFEDEYLKLAEYNATDHLRLGMGAEALLEVVSRLDLNKLSEELKTEVNESSGQRRVKATKRLRVVEGYRRSGQKPEWMFMSTLPVLPPDLRPMVQLSGGRFAASDLNDLYRRVINRNNRLRHLINLGAPDIILRNEKRMLQEAVDALIDSAHARNSRRLRRRPLKSLSEMLRGKQGRFRQNLLGKRVDYSGRSVIVVGPELKLNQCGLPKEMALEMFKPFVLRELIKLGYAPNIRSARFMLERRQDVVYDILESITKDHPVLLNRAPTLHKLGIQAFYPVLVEGSAIRLHPCVCSGYNADFDGDQMAVHVPLSKRSIEEARAQMMPQNNLLKPADMTPITVPNKDMAMGAYYMTSIDPTVEKSPIIFASVEEAEHAYQQGLIGLRQPITVRYTYDDGHRERIETTVGRLQFNAVIPDELGFFNEEITAGKIKDMVRKAINIFDAEQTARIIDSIKNLGFAMATKSGLSVAVTDCVMLDEKNQIIDQANKRAEEVQDSFLQGLITRDERRRLTFEVWMQTTDEVADKTWNNLEETNAIKIMINSGGTRASKDQVKQLSAMRGLVVDPMGRIVEMPTKSNFREGLSIFEYVTSARGSRKGLTDSALKTADAGYLTRRLCDVSHDSIIRAVDCETTEGIEITRVGEREKVFGNRILGRFAAKDIEADGQVIVKAGEMIDEAAAERVVASSAASATIRSPLTCQLQVGMCAHCYGWDFSTKKVVELGTPVGVVAAQSIGEPGTQLTMRVKHSGGIVGLDVTQGLPRVEELFEIRTPKGLAPISEIAGEVKVVEKEDSKEIVVSSTGKPQEIKTYIVPRATQVLVEDGSLVHAGQQLAGGSLDLRDVLKLRGLRAAQQYLIDEVQRVYESQGISINDKHFEVIAAKMSDKVMIESSGDTSLLPGEIVDRMRFREENESVLAEGGEPATAQVLVLGITRAALYTESWLSAASFQHTTNVLTQAASQGKLDRLLGLKENVIIGRLIPTSPERASIEL